MIHTVIANTEQELDGAKTPWGGRIGDEKTNLMIQALFRCLKIRDPITALHSLHMAELNYLLAKDFDLANAELYYGAALTHDIGKLGMADRILKGSSRLSGDDKVQLFNHVTDGYRLLQSLEMPGIILETVKYHHERYDGSGYVVGLTGTDIPLPGRIAAVTDTYSALTSFRPYQKALEKHEAINIMMKDKEKFDPIILESFLTRVSSTT